MLSQIEASPVELLAAPTPEEAVAIDIDVLVNKSLPPTVVFSIAMPGLGVDVDSKDPSILIVHPGSYFLNFNVLNDQLKNPALLVKTPFGVLNVTPTGTSTVTLSNTNLLELGQSDQIFSFSFNFSSGPIDPTIVNTPDPASP